MKLISLYIENFGGLRQYALDFEADLTVIRKENGFGKSTLAEFIRAMFYGFPRKAKTLDKSRRQKYTPWNGGTFGGSLTFELENNRYRIERIFTKNGKDEHFKVIDLSTAKECDTFGDCPGYSIFGVNSEAFIKSAFITRTLPADSKSDDHTVSPA